MLSQVTAPTRAPFSTGSLSLGGRPKDGPGTICLGADANDSTQDGDPRDLADQWIDGDYHLKSQAGRWDPNTGSWVQDDVTSLCIDAGDPNSPIGEEPFPNGGRINMGAYGGTAEASRSYFGEPVSETIIAGDINGDEQGANQDKMQIAEKNERGAKGRI
jgi:hypothetical protein